MTSAPPRIKVLAQQCVARMNSLSLKGQKRDDAVVNFYVGAVQGAMLAGDKDLADHIACITMLLIATRGYYFEVKRMAS